MTRSLLGDFKIFCDEAIAFSSENKNPYYLNHVLEPYVAKTKGKGYFFGAALKAYFQRFTTEKFTIDELVDQLRDALPDGEKYAITKHNTGKLRGIFVHEDFFDIVMERY